MPMFAGAHTALVTPFRAGALDETALVSLVDAQLAAGIQGLVPCGTTGESVNLSQAEYAKVVATVVERSAGRVPVLAGAGGAATGRAIELGTVAKQAGADGLLVVAPYYNRPTQAGLIAHYEAIVEAVDLPLILYNIPGRTGCDLEVETMAVLARDSRVVGIKEATGRVQRIDEILAAFGERFTVLCGDDGLTLPAMALGAHGVISVVSHLAPKWVVELVMAMGAGDLTGARQRHAALRPLIGAAFAESNPGPVKLALELLGVMSAEVRLPLVRPSAATVSKIKAALQSAGKL